MDVTILCKACGFTNDMLASTCASTDCGHDMPDDATKLRLLLQRLQTSLLSSRDALDKTIEVVVKQPSDTGMSVDIICEWCDAFNLPTAAHCENCEEAMPSAEARLRLLQERAHHLVPYTAIPSRYKDIEDRLRTVTAELDAQRARNTMLEAEQSARAGFDIDCNVARQRLAHEIRALEQHSLHVRTLQSMPPVAPADVVVMDEPPLYGDLFVLHKVWLNGLPAMRKSLHSSKVERLRRNGKLHDTLEKVKRSFATLHRLHGGSDTLIKIVGASGLSAISQDPVVYMPLASRGSLRSVLGPTNKNMPWATRLDIALTMARGLAELHAMNCTHGAINTAHVLVDDACRVVLTGMCHIDDPTAETRDDDENLVAPEILRGHSFSEKADVFAFGLLLVYLATDQRPYTNCINAITGKPFSQYALRHRLAHLEEGDPLLQHDLGPTTPSSFAAIVHQCLAVEPSRRPSMVDIVGSLRREVESSVFPMLPPVAPVAIQVVLQRVMGLLGAGTDGAKIQCHLKLGTSQSRTRMAEQRGASAEWGDDDVFVSELDLASSTILEVRVVQETRHGPRLIGVCTVPLHTLMPRGDDDGNWTVEIAAPVYKDVQPEGELTLRVLFMGDDHVRWRQTYEQRLQYMQHAMQATGGDDPRRAHAQGIQCVYEPEMNYVVLK